MAKQKTYSLKDLPIGTKVVLDVGVRGIVKKPRKDETYVRFGKSLWLTHRKDGSRIRLWARVFLKSPIVEIIKPKTKAKK